MKKLVLLKWPFEFDEKESSKLVSSFYMLAAFLGAFGSVWASI